MLLYPPYSCGLCVPCRRGLDMHCERHEFTGLSRDGGFAEYVARRRALARQAPPGVEPADVAPHADAGITAYHAVKGLVPRLVPGSTAVVIGVGGVGHIALQLLRVLGARTVVAIDTDERRRALARELGADEVLGDEATSRTVREATNGAGADVVLDFVATDATHAAASRCWPAAASTRSSATAAWSRRRRSALVVGEERRSSATSSAAGSTSGSAPAPRQRGGSTLRTETHPLEEVNEVLDRLREGEITGRAVLVP